MRRGSPNFEVVEMAELKEHSTQFDSDLRIEDLPKDTLVKLLRLYAQLYWKLDGFWYLSAKERVNNEEALTCDIWVWERQTKQEISGLTKLLKIDGNDVMSMMKTLQVSPWGFSHKFEVEFKNRNDAVLTFTYCPALEALEKEGEGREQTICRVVDPVVKRRFAGLFNPAIEVVPLKLPPRESREGVCCQWRFRLE